MQLARETDGHVSATIHALVRSAADQTSGGRLLMEMATSKAFLFLKDSEGRAQVNAPLMLQASRLLESGRQSMLAAHHLQQLEAEARARSAGPIDPQAALRAQLGIVDEDGDDAQ